MFNDNYTPVSGTLTISLSAGVVWDMETSGLIPPNANRATISTYGGLVHYLSTGENPSTNFGRPVPPNEEVLLNNIVAVRQLKVVAAEEDCSMTIAFFKGNR